jgi:NitT/TauT family transport system permease protein
MLDISTGEATTARQASRPVSRAGARSSRRPRGINRLRALGRQVLLASITFAVLGLAWELLSNADPSFWPEIILSKPSEIAPAFFEAVTTKFVWEHYWVTIQATLLGFVIGALAGLVLGLLIALIPMFSEAFYPVVILFQSTPRVALAPVFIAWFGFGMTSKIALAATICFFPVLVNTITGLQQVDENALLLMRSLKASRWQIFKHLRAFAALPTIFAGLKAALTFALIGVIVGELKATNEGAGFLIERGSFQLRMDDVFAYLGMLALFGLLLYAVANAIERRVVFWQAGDGEHD